MENSKIKLSRAQIVLNVLSELYSNESKRSYNDPEYDRLYSIYEQSFRNKLIILEASESVLSATAHELMNIRDIHSEYKRSLNEFGYFDQNYANYILPDSLSEWSLKNIVTVKDGRLIFLKFDDSMILKGLDSSGVEELTQFFTSNAAYSYEQMPITQFEESIRSLSERMSSYLNTTNDFIQWGYAREFLIMSLINNNPELNFLNNYFNGLGEMDRNGSLGSVNIKPGTFERIISLYTYLDNNNIWGSLNETCQKAWEGLSEQQRADLEFYTILTLNNTDNNYFNEFSNVLTFKLYEAVYNRIKLLYDVASFFTSTWFFFPINALLSIEIRDVNGHALNNITPSYEAMKEKVNTWINGLKNNFSLINVNNEAYIQLSEHITLLEGIAAGQNIEWEDIYKTLSGSGKVNEQDLAEIESSWNKMKLEIKDDNIKIESVPEALITLFQWIKLEEQKNKRILEEYWYNSSQNQKRNEDDYLSAVNAYLAGTIGINELKAAALDSYGPAASAWKNHVDNINTVMLNNLSMYLNIENDYRSEFMVLGDEITSLTKRIMENRYDAEFKVREAEWIQTIRDLNDKFNEWQTSSALILEAGRTDWITSRQKMEDAYQQWVINFQDEYNRVNDEWNIVYLAGLEDKERWLEQAGNAANQAAAESFLLLMGTEGERLSYFIDTREPFGIRESVPQAQALVADLIQSSGIISMSNAFNSLNNISNTASAQVRRGMGGVSTWDTALVKTAAADLARQANIETADNETRKLAYNVRLYADEAIRGLTTAVDSANQNFRESMDDLFIFKGLWRKIGDDYVKDVLKGSTLFAAIITKTVTVSGYENYEMGTVTLQTNLDENHLASFESFVIMELLESAIDEVQTIASAIFGIGEDKIKIASTGGTGDERELSPGLFGAHIGYSPERKEIPEGKSESEIFNDYGSGELGRLLTQFYYWMIIDNAGNAELVLAPWDKRMWDDEGSWFSSPSLRTVGNIAASVAVGFATGGLGFWASLGVSLLVVSSSEILFGALDLAYEYKTLDEVAFNVGKSIATSAASGLTAGFFNGMTNIATSSMSNSFNKVLTQSIMKGVETTVSGLVTNSINAITYNRSDGWGYDTEAFKAGTEKLWINAFSATAGAFTTKGLQVINSGWELEKIEDFSILNQNDLTTFNKLAGSLVGQGVNYLFGEDFTLNVLNVGLFTDKNVQTGLIELRFNRNNDGIRSQFGTGGANVSIDNIISSFRGIEVWNVNNQINNFSNNNEDLQISTALRSLYGYGQNEGKSLLWEIINGKVDINTNAAGDYRAHSTGTNDRKTIHLTNYQQNMSKEDQRALAITLLHEAYRDNNVTSDNYLETRTAVQAHTEMAIRMMFDGKTIADDANITMDIAEYIVSIINGGNMDSFYSYVDEYYDSSEDFWKLTRRSDGSFFWDEDGRADFDISILLNDPRFINIHSPEKSNILTALGLSQATDGKRYGVISADRMSSNLAYSLHTVINNAYLNSGNYYTSPFYTDTIDKIEFNRLYSTTIYDSRNRPVTLFNIDSVNNVNLVKQIDFRGIEGLENIVNYGCNFMLIIGIPQLLTRTAFNQEEIVDLWYRAIELGIIFENGYVDDRSALANLAFEQLGIANVGIKITDNERDLANLNTVPSLMGFRQQMYYRSSVSGYEGSHYVLISILNSLVYNGSNYWNDDSDYYRFLGVYAYAR